MFYLIKSLKKFIFKKLGQSKPLFVLFTFQFKWQIYNLNNKNWKCIDGVLGTQTWGCTMEGTDEYTKLWRPLNHWKSEQSKKKCCTALLWYANTLFISSILLHIFNTNTFCKICWSEFCYKVKMNCFAKKFNCQIQKKLTILLKW